MKKPGKKSIIPAMVIAGGLAYNTLGDVVSSTYQKITPDNAQHEVAPDYKANALEEILTPAKAYAGEAEASTQPHIPDELKGDPVYQWFDGGVYEWGSEDFPDDRYDFRRALKSKDGDLAQVFESDNPLYDFIGKPLESKYNNDTITKIVFDYENKKEFGVIFSIDGKYFVGFKDMQPKLMSLIKGHNNK